MSASSGPDLETWKKMSPRAKRIHLTVIGFIWTIILIAIGVKLFS